MSSVQLRICDTMDPSAILFWVCNFFRNTRGHLRCAWNVVQHAVFRTPLAPMRPAGVFGAGPRTVEADGPQREDPAGHSLGGEHIPWRTHGGDDGFSGDMFCSSTFQAHWGACFWSTRLAYPQVLRVWNGGCLGTGRPEV